MFVYYQCFPKLIQRLNIPAIRGGPRMMRELFLGDAVTKEDFVAQFVSRDPEYWEGKIDEKILHEGDQQITRLWHEADIPRFTAETDGNPDAVYYVLDAEIAFEIHHLTCSLFDTITTALPTIEHGRRGSQEDPTEEQLATLEGALTDLGAGIRSLSRLIRAPIFWKYLYHPWIIAWVQGQTGGIDNVSCSKCHLLSVQC